MKSLILSLVVFGFISNLQAFAMDNENFASIEELKLGEDCGRAVWGEQEAQDLIPNTICSEGLACNEFSYRDHDGWDGYTCGYADPSEIER